PTTVFIRCSSATSLTATRAPSCASRLAIPRRIPCAAPVTSATTPSSLPTSDHHPSHGREDLADEVVSRRDEEGDGVRHVLRMHLRTARRRTIGFERAHGDAVHSNAVPGHLEREALGEGEDAPGRRGLV